MADKETPISDAVKKYAGLLRSSKNIIFHGAPGTGKTYLARQIAAFLISNGKHCDYDALSPEKQKQVGFVQFHPGYDYVDFVGGLRPCMGKDGTSMAFVPRDGVFTQFVNQAQEHPFALDGSMELPEMKRLMVQYLKAAQQDGRVLETKQKRPFTICQVDETAGTFVVEPRSNQDEKTLQPVAPLQFSELLTLLFEYFNLPEDDDKKQKEFTTVNYIASLLHQTTAKGSGYQKHSYYLPLLQPLKTYINDEQKASRATMRESPFVFIIDEINRGEISKIFGELFFAIDPGYRGKAGGVITQYSTLLQPDRETDTPPKKFYLPENLYIIGTMNDIDRSVDTFDFAMRRRFRFLELKADEHTEMLDQLEPAQAQTARACMRALNTAISQVEDLNDHYQIGAAYFLKLKELSYDYDALWSDYLAPLLQEYVQGLNNEAEILGELKRQYDSARTA